MWVNAKVTAAGGFGFAGVGRRGVTGQLCGLAFALAVLPACGATESEDTEDTDDDVVAQGPTDNPLEGLQIASECQGLDFNGLVYSPGGAALPNICEPFHATTNNPYAIRCVDAWPWYDTGFPGDEFCILPPEPSMGYQIGMHPQGAGDAWFNEVSVGDMSGYDNPPDDWVMEGGQEEQVNYTGGADNPEGFDYYRTNTRMRAGSHHMINSVAPASDPRHVWSRGNSSDGLSGRQGLPGAQRPDVNVPNTTHKPEEDAGLYEEFPASPTLTFNVHHFNPSDRQILKEAWVNMWREEDATVLVRAISINSYVPVQNISIALISPGDTADLHYAFSITEPVRVVTLFGHRHAWTTNFSAWVERGDELEIVYQSFGWLDEPTYRYDSGDENPEPQPDLVIDGGHSGILTLQPGERLHFNCHIEYTDEQQARAGAPNSPSSQGNLMFANEAFTAEMCLMFGTTAGVSMPGASRVNGELPGFATID